MSSNELRCSKGSRNSKIRLRLCTDVGVHGIRIPTIPVPNWPEIGIARMLLA